MNLTFLGTAAAEAYPAPFCSCPNCETARRNRGRDLRRRASLLVNDDLLIDFGPDVFQGFQQFGLRATALRSIVLTHSHGDHLAADNLAYRGQGFITQTDLVPITVYGPADAIDLAQVVMASELEEARMNLVSVTAGDVFQAGRYSVYALPAVHGRGEIEALIYMVEHDGHRFLYGTDTGSLNAKAWEMLTAAPPALAILDATMGTLSSTGHMGIEQLTRAAASLRGLCGEGLPVIAHHFSHQANPSYEELVRVYGERGIRVSYDGMTVDVP